MTDESVEEDVRRLSEAFYAEQAKNPDVVPYIGPEDTLQRFLAGAVITTQDLVCDQSLFTVQAVLPAQMKRLRWMLDHSEAGA